jgi:hypothetical protein
LSTRCPARFGGRVVEMWELLGEALTACLTRRLSVLDKMRCATKTALAKKGTRSTSEGWEILRVMLGRGGRVFWRKSAASELLFCKTE